MGDTRRGFLASAGALAVILVLVGCSSLGDSNLMTNAQAAGQSIGSVAATATPTPTPGASAKGWVDTTGCPPGLQQGFVEGLGSGATASQTTPSTSSGPTAFPTLTSQYVPSCAFTFTTNGVNAKAEIFIDMDQSYEQGFVTTLTQAGYTESSQSGHYTYYSSGVSVIGLAYVTQSDNGVLERAVIVVSATR